MVERFSQHSPLSARQRWFMRKISLPKNSPAVPVRQRAVRGRYHLEYRHHLTGSSGDGSGHKAGEGSN